MRGIGGALLLLACAGALTACSGSSSGQASSPAPMTQVTRTAGASGAASAPPSSAATSAAPSPASAVSSPAPTGPAAATSPAARPSPSPTVLKVAGFYGFESPSGNIGCIVDTDPSGAAARCDIAQYTFTPPPKPADCPLDWGDAFTVGTGGPAAGLCHGDTALHAGAVLPYGTAVQDGPFLCLSEESGVSCRNTGTGHGFTLARDAYRTF